MDYVDVSDVLPYGTEEGYEAPQVFFEAWKKSPVVLDNRTLFYP